jgi:hypothetical protein
MLSKAQKSTRSSTESVQTDSVRGGATSNLNRGISHQSSISEEVDNANSKDDESLDTEYYLHLVQNIYFRSIK